MEGLIATAQAILKGAQLLGLVSAAIAFCVGGYFLMLGGDSGRRKSVGWFVGAAVGLVVVMGALGIATSIDDNIKF
ncbi:hypothetical protein [Bhargavaea beijingensis]|uniref:hypothetical protein n=1 Tax=Bhargavaea beijingensis TaxID=426756 RepID=UPI002225545E|nr:hypothetical protein [Bhargavaea beijingensis]MCW1929562.1 hypothetical protein [Bhargavaea beijingensis]